MRKQKKQSLLTVIITILVIALIMMIGSIVYEEKINMNKQETQNTIAPIEKESENVEEKEESSIENDIQEIPTEEDEEFIGEEEQKEDTTKDDATKSKDEKAIDLAQKEWGDDESVTFNVEKKSGDKYYVAVKREATVVQWYEVDTETWEISEY